MAPVSRLSPNGLAPSVPAASPEDGALRPRVVWIGSAEGLELGMARAGVAAHADVTHADTPQQAAAIAAAAAGADSTPVFAVLAADRPGRFTMADALLLSRAWPLMPIVSVASSLVDGRRRSGPALPGIEEVPWHDLPSRSAWWLAAIVAGRPTSLGLPATSRREERLLESIVGVRCGHRQFDTGPKQPRRFARSATHAADRFEQPFLAAGRGWQAEARGQARLDGRQPRPAARNGCSNRSAACVADLANRRGCFGPVSSCR
ncbi:MAG: hypothetical protein ACKOHG_20930, partial [Planctomycetia bacterium]